MAVNKLLVNLVAVIFILCVVGAFFLGRSTRRVDDVGVRIERDTIIVRDTFREYYPQEVVREKVRTEKVEVPVLVRDTICDTVYVEIPIESREYRTDELYAVVEGYNPILKYYEVYPRTVYVNTTETIKQRKRWGFGVGLQGGYGFTPKGWQPYVGVGLSFNYLF